MTETTCEEFRDKIVDYVDGVLPPNEAQIVAGHLTECPRCRQTARDLQRSLGLARILWQDNLGEATAIRGDSGHCRSMGVPPMSGRAVPAVSSTGTVPVAAPDTHGRDAHATLGPYGHAANLPRRRSFYAVAVAASILLATGVLVTPIFHQGPGNQVLAAEQIEQQVARAGLAAELLAATQMIARCEGTESIVERQYQYILRDYADTPAAKVIRAGSGSGGM